MPAEPLTAEVPGPVSALRRSPLADHPGLAGVRSAGGRGVDLAEVPFLAQVVLRVTEPGPAADRVAQLLGVRLPTTPNTVATVGARAVLWLRPDEWLVVGPDGDLPALARGLTDAVGADPGTVVDVSANRTVVEVRGPDARHLLCKGIALDLHPRAFSAGRCAQTLLARTQVVLWQTGDAPAYRLLVRASFACYLADWLVDGAFEYEGEGTLR